MRLAGHWPLAAYLRYKKGDYPVAALTALRLGTSPLQADITGRPCVDSDGLGPVSPLRPTVGGHRAQPPPPTELPALCPHTGYTHVQHHAHGSGAEPPTRAPGPSSGGRRPRPADATPWEAPTRDARRSGCPYTATPKRRRIGYNPPLPPGVMRHPSENSPTSGMVCASASKLRPENPN